MRALEAIYVLFLFKYHLLFSILSSIHSVNRKVGTYCLVESRYPNCRLSPCGKRDSKEKWYHMRMYYHDKLKAGRYTICYKLFNIGVAYRKYCFNTKINKVSIMSASEIMKQMYVTSYKTLSKINYSLQ